MFYLQLTVLKNVPYAPLMNVSVVLKDIPHNHGHHVLTVPSCMVVTLKVSAKLFYQTVQLSQTVSHVLLDNVENVKQVSNLMLIKNVLLSDHSM